MEEVFLNREPVFEGGVDREAGECSISEPQVETAGTALSNDPPQPTVGLEFSSFDEAYDFYNSYARQFGFGIRVSNSWFRSKQKERYRAKFSCSNAGFKRKTEANQPRPETRTGCPAMIIVRLVDSKIWRIIEVEMQHNHPFSTEGGRSYKSHKKMVLSAKEVQKNDPVAEVHIIKLYRAPAMDASLNLYVNTNVDLSENRNIADCSKHLKLKDGDTHAIYNFCCRMKLTDPNFFYLVDLDDEGCLRNIFWADSRSRVAYEYFGDTIMIDTACSATKYELPLITFVGVNNHGSSIMLGCSLVASELVENFIWVFKAWLACMLGRPPQVIITDQSKLLEGAVASVFPGASHCYSLCYIMRRLPEKLGGLVRYEAIRKQFSQTIYGTSKLPEFETSWALLIKQHGLGSIKWLQDLHEDRRKWAPVYLKGIFFAGMMPIQENDDWEGYFDGYVHKHTTIKEFLDKWELAVHRKYLNDAKADQDSRTSFVQKTKSGFELQLSKVYTKDIFNRFKQEVEGMYSCFNTKQVIANGPIVTYLVRERVKGDNGAIITKLYDVLFEATMKDIRCICSLFNFKGYLCRHALTVLNYIGIEEIPSQYILQRWSRDFQSRLGRGYMLNDIEVKDPLKRYHLLISRGLQLVACGSQSEKHYQILVEELENLASNTSILEK